MALVSWYLGTLLLVLIRTQAYAAPAPENEVPLRPTTWLPEGKLMTVTLPKGRTRRLYFTLKKKVAAMSVTVSPCDVQIEWSLSARILKDKPVSEKPLKSLQWSSRKSLPEVWWKSPGTEEKIHSFKGNRVDTYTSSSLPSASIYILRLRSRQQSSRATVYHHEGKGSPGVFPLVPADPQVHTLGVGMTSVTLSWAPSLSITNLPDSQKSYEYCVLVNSENNHHGLCSAQESVSKGQRKEKKERKERKRVTAWPMLKEWWWEQWVTEADPLPAEPQCACQGTESDCTVSDLLPDTKYYFDVFVLDRVNGTSAAYKGMAAQTHEEARSVITSLREGELRWVTFPNREPKSDQFFSFHPRSSQGSGLLNLQGCSRGEMIRVKVSSKGQVLTSEAIGVDLVQIWLQGSSSYLIHLEREESPKAQDARLDSATSVKIQTSSAYHRRGVPSMPSTLQVKSFNRLRGCNSVTLAWMGTEERSLYCVYRRQLRTEETEASLNMPCLGPESRSDTERVLCKYFQELNPRRAVTTAVIGGLEPGVAYVFDVYLMRRWGIPVKYASKVVRTRKEC